MNLSPCPPMVNERALLVDKLLLYGLNNILIGCNCLNLSHQCNNYEIDLCLFMNSAKNNPSSEEYFGMVVEMIKAYIEELLKKSEFQDIKIIFDESDIKNGKLLFNVTF